MDEPFSPDDTTRGIPRKCVSGKWLFAVTITNTNQTYIGMNWIHKQMGLEQKHVTTYEREYGHALAMR